MDTVWVGVAFVIFFAILAYFGVPKAIVAALDARGEKVAQELAEARRLRLEAEKLLAEYEAKRKAAETEAASIVAAANEEAKRLAAEAETHQVGRGEDRAGRKPGRGRGSRRGRRSGDQGGRVDHPLPGGRQGRRCAVRRRSQRGQGQAQLRRSGRRVAYVHQDR